MRDEEKRNMTEDVRIQQMLDELLDSDTTPEVVCASCPELLPVVRNRWRQMRRLRADLEDLFPSPTQLTPKPHEDLSLPQIPGYEVEGLLGRGGMSLVFRAQHLSLKRLVALKMLLAGAYAEPDQLARFRREAQAVAALRHPNIVQVHDAGEVAGRPYFTMECVEGGTLARSLAGQAQPPRRAAEMAATLASAVQFAHKSGFIHRDLKPANILVTADGILKITDFGLVRSIAAGPEVTRSGDFLGTPCYMAPEQAMGHASAVGPPADIYALGVMFYEMLSARPPFEAETPSQTIQQVIGEEPSPPSRWNAKVPRDLDTICLKCLQKKPSRRYASAQDLADDLHRFLDGKPVLARPVGLLERTAKWARRRPATALLAVVFLAVLAAGVATVVWMRHQENDRNAANEQRKLQARGSLQTALKRADDLGREERWKEALVVLDDVSPQLAIADLPSLNDQFQRMQADIRSADELQGVRENYPLLPDGAVNYKQRAEEFVKGFERAGFRIDDDVERVADYIRSSAIRDQLVAALEERALVASMLRDPPLVERLMTIARLADPGSPWRDRFRNTANWERRESLNELAATAFTSSPGPTEQQLALLALLLRAHFAWGRSADLLGEACQRQPRNFWVHREMGYVLVFQNQNRDAAGYYRAALSLRPNNASAHEGLALCLKRLGQTDEAIAAYRRAVQIAPNNSATRTRLVEVLSNGGYWKEAQKECRLAHEVDHANYRPLLYLHSALYNVGRIEEAVVPVCEALEIDPNSAEIQYTLGSLYAKLGRHKEAVKELRPVKESNSPFRFVERQLGQELAAGGQWEEAITVLNAAAARDPKNPWFPLELGRIYRAHGKPEAAAEALQNAVAHAPGLADPLDELIPTLLSLDRYVQARTALEARLKVHATDTERRAQQRQLDLCNTMLTIESKLPSILAGKERPTDAATQRALAECCLQYKRLPATAADYYALALSAQPSLAEDLETENRAHAAGAAALAGCGIGDDTVQLDDLQRLRLRKQALDWLSAEYKVCAERHLLGKPGDRAFVATVLRSWLRDANFTAVRDESMLGRLTSDEQNAWKDLWGKIAALAERDPSSKIEQAQDHVARMEWEKAARCYAEGIELEPTDNAELWFEYAAAQLLAGDQAGYRQTCAHMLARCQPAGPMRPYLVARACTLAAESYEQAVRVSALSRNELLERNQTEFWALTELGALPLRSRVPKDGVVFLEKSLVADGRPGRAVLNWLWLALIHHKLGSPSEAKRWLDKAVNWLDQQGGRMPGEEPFMGSHLHNWLEAQVLRREAESLLR
jgi:serine/threonine-protein kinase